MRLHRPRARLQRAYVHREKFSEIWNRFLHDGDEPYYPIVTVDDDGEGEIWIRVAEGFPGEQLSLYLGELLYQLRAALDSLVYELAILDSGKDPPPKAESLEFLVRASQTSFEDAAWKIKPLSDQHRSMIDSIQPYDVGERGEGEEFVAAVLKELNDLARKDRHRGLRVVASWVSNLNPQIESLSPGCSVEWIRATEDGLFKDEAEIARFKIAGWTPESEIEANPNCALDVAIDDAPPPVDDEDRLNKRIVTMLSVVKVLIESFEETFD